MDLLSNYVIPEKISGYFLKRFRVGNISKFTYCKDDLFIAPIFLPQNEINTALFEEYRKEYSTNVLYDIVAQNDIIETKLKEKLFLNEKILTFYDSSMASLGYDTTQILPFKDSFTLMKLFDLYSIIDSNTNAVFYAVVSVFPLAQTPYIIEQLNHLSEKQRKKFCINFTTEDFSTKEVIISNKVHLFSFSADNEIETIREIYSKSGWKMKLINEQAILAKQKRIEEKIDNIILCEGTDVDILNSLNIRNVDFSDEHNSYTIFQNVKTQKRKCLRDKDYLTTEEVYKLKQKFSKYYILNYYCIENYLYHPENIKELIGIDFIENDYIDFLILKKNNLLDDLLSKIIKSRDSYADLKENHINPTKEGELVIYKELISDKFEDFYKHLDMKNINKSYLDKYNLNKRKLSSTTWFRKSILNILKLNNY